MIRLKQVYVLVLTWFLQWTLIRLTKASFLVWYPCTVLPPGTTMKKWALEAWRYPWSRLPARHMDMAETEYVVVFRRLKIGIEPVIPYRYIPSWENSFFDVEPIKGVESRESR